MTPNDQLAAAIKAGKAYHCFSATTGNYICSYFFPGSALNFAISTRKEFAADVVVKYLTNMTRRNF